MRRCCVSKARPEALLGSGGAAADSAGGLAAELRGLKLSQIRKRAEALGIAAALGLACAVIVGLARVLWGALRGIPGAAAQVRGIERVAAEARAVATYYQLVAKGKLLLGYYQVRARPSSLPHSFERARLATPTCVHAHASTPTGAALVPRTCAPPFAGRARDARGL